LKQAETVLIKTVQSENFATEIATLHSTELNEKTKNDLKKSNLYRLDHFLDDCGVLRVGGRLRRSNQDFVEKHPAILRTPPFTPGNYPPPRKGVSSGSTDYQWGDPSGRLLDRLSQSYGIAIDERLRSM
jgi:hypothetical protein